MIIGSFLWILATLCHERFCYSFMGSKEHDDITKAWLAEADLLVYVFAPDLFNRHSGERFFRLLDKFRRAQRAHVGKALDPSDLNKFKPKLCAISSNRAGIDITGKATTMV